MDNYRVIYSSPYDARVEYLENSVGQQIDTGIVSKTGIKIEIDFKFNSYGADQQNIIRGEDNKFWIKLYKSNNYIAYINSNLSQIISDNLYDRYHVIMDSTNRNLYVNDVTYQFSSTPQNYTSSYTLKLFYTTNTEARIYFFKIWDNNVLVRDFIPVRVGTVGYMYDRVSKKLFGNQGTGNFILGQDVANPVPNIRRVFRFNNKRFVMPMPYDSKIEYLETDGTQYINTDIYTSNTIGFEINAMGLSGTTQYHAAGFFINNKLNNVCIFGSSNGGIVGCFGGDTNNASSPGRIVAPDYDWQNEKRICKLNKGSFYVDGNLIGSTSYTLTSFNKIWIGAINNIAKQSGRIYGAKVWDNNVLIRDFIPVRRGNVGYLYDKVSGKLFGNAGTGQFILGNDIND